MVSAQHTPGVRLHCCPLSAPVLSPGDVAADGGERGEEAAQHQQGEHSHRVQQHHARGTRQTQF